jgi:hypothetical protein
VLEDRNEESTEPELIAPRMKNIVTKIAPTMIQPSRFRSIAVLTTERKPSFEDFDFGSRKSFA